jgi:hypothetical protein
MYYLYVQSDKCIFFFLVLPSIFIILIMLYMRSKNSLCMVAPIHSSPGAEARTRAEARHTTGQSAASTAVAAHQDHCALKLQ